jgi:hypothetical protein
MDKEWCGWEEKEFDREDFETYQGGPLLEHLHVKPRHTNNGIAIGGPGPEPGAANESQQRNDESASSMKVTYGYGPMARRPGDD